MCPDFDFTKVTFSIWKGTYTNKDGQGLSPTKYLLGFLTSTVTLISVPLIRIILKGNKKESSIAETVYWLFVSVFGFAIIIYPWWLATSSSSIYYNRLQKYTAISGSISLILVIARGLLAPSEPFLYNQPEDTTLSFRVVSSLWWVAALLGFLVVLPWFIREKKILQSKSRALFTFVLPFVVIMLTAVLLQEWTGSSFVTAYSPVALLVLFGAASVLEKPIMQTQSQQYSTILVRRSKMYPA